MSWVAGFDLGGTRVKALVWDTVRGVVVERRTCPTRDGEITDGLPAWAASVRELMAEWEAALGPAMGAAVSCPGLVAIDNKRVLAMPGRLAGLEGLDWSAVVGRGFSVPVLNDAHAALLGEAWQGAARGKKDVVLLTLGTGVGGAVLCEGRLLRGARNRGGHLGHVTIDPDGAPDITGMPGSLEDAVGDATIAARTGGRFHSTADLVAAVRADASGGGGGEGGGGGGGEAGDPVAREAWERCIRALGCAVGGFINLFDPEVLVIGGGIAEAGDALFGPLARVLDEVEWRPCGWKTPVVRAELGEWAGAYGAAKMALDTHAGGGHAP